MNFSIMLMAFEIYMCNVTKFYVCQLIALDIFYMYNKTFWFRRKNNNKCKKNLSAICLGIRKKLSTAHKIYLMRKLIKGTTF